MHIRNILIADDDLVWAHGLAARLRSLGYRADVLGNGTEAAARFKAHSEGSRLPDLLVVDIDLPDLSGVELLSAIMREGMLCTVLLTSPSLGEADLARLIRTPHVGYIDKQPGTRRAANEITGFCPILNDDDLQFRAPVPTTA